MKKIYSFRIGCTLVLDCLQNVQNLSNWWKGMSINDIRRFLMIFDLPTYHVVQFLPSNVLFLGVILNLPTLKSDVINGRSQTHLFIFFLTIRIPNRCSNHIVYFLLSNGYITFGKIFITCSINPASNIKSGDKFWKIIHENVERFSIPFWHITIYKGHRFETQRCMFSNLTFILPEMSELFGGHALCNYASILRPRISDLRSKEASELVNEIWGLDPYKGPLQEHRDGKIEFANSRDMLQQI